MNNDVLSSVQNPALSKQAALEENLIAALTKLQHATFAKDLLAGSAPLAEDAKPEAFFGFCIGTYHFMVAANCVCEVLVETAIAAIPNAPSCLVGLSNVRGVLMPIYQLHSALALAPPKKIIIFSVGKGDAAVGILIDALPISLMVSALQRHAVSPSEKLLLQSLVQAHYRVDQQLWLRLDGVELGAQLLVVAGQSPPSLGYISARPEAAYS
jgi:chemotaxis signal transduction protein